jgi:GTPase
MMMMMLLLLFLVVLLSVENGSHRHSMMIHGFTTKSYSTLTIRPSFFALSSSSSSSIPRAATIEGPRGGRRWDDEDEEADFTAILAQPTSDQASRGSKNKRSPADAATSTTTKKSIIKNNNNDDPEWKFYDTARIRVEAGDGGNGCVAFRREKGAPLGGPSGGRGGRGGDIYFICDQSLNTLMPLRQKVHHRATPGLNGTGKNRDGTKGTDIYIRVPIGTVVRDLATQRLAGELSSHSQMLLVAKGGRGGRGNAAFLTGQRTSPKLAERGEPGTGRWLTTELRLVADVGFLGLPNAGKSTLLAAASNARPKIADYPFTTIVPNLGVCDIGNEDGTAPALVLCDIPGLIEGAADGAGMGGAFLRHVQRCRVLLHVVDGTSDDPLRDFTIINEELRRYDECLAQKPQVVVLNKIDVPFVAERKEQLLRQLRTAAGHSRVLPISAATRTSVPELMRRLRQFVAAQPEPDLPPPPEIDLSKAGLDHDGQDYDVVSDPSYPGQWRVTGRYIEQIARMTHWEYPEAVERFGRQLYALGISEALSERGALEGDLIMIDQYDFDFSPSKTNPYIPSELLEEENDLFFGGKGGAVVGRGGKDVEKEPSPRWRPFQQGGYMDDDSDEILGFGDDQEWSLLEGEDDMDDDEFLDEDGNFQFEEGDEVFTSQ